MFADCTASAPSDGSSKPHHPFKTQTIALQNILQLLLIQKIWTKSNCLDSYVSQPPIRCYGGCEDLLHGIDKIITVPVIIEVPLKPPSQQGLKSSYTVLSPDSIQSRVDDKVWRLSRTYRINIDVPPLLCCFQLIFA